MFLPIKTTASKIVDNSISSALHSNILMLFLLLVPFLNSLSFAQPVDEDIVRSYQSSCMMVGSKDQKPPPTSLESFFRFYLIDVALKSVTDARVCIDRALRLEAEPNSKIISHLDRLMIDLDPHLIDVELRIDYRIILARQLPEGEIPQPGVTWVPISAVEVWVPRIANVGRCPASFSENWYRPDWPAALVNLKPTGGSEKVPDCLEAIDVVNQNKKQRQTIVEVVLQIGDILRTLKQQRILIQKYGIDAEETSSSKKSLEALETKLKRYKKS